MPLLYVWSICFGLSGRGGCDSRTYANATATVAAAGNDAVDVVEGLPDRRFSSKLYRLLI